MSQAVSSEKNRTPVRHRRRAFTLVEMMVVIMIIGVFGALALPRLGSSIDYAKVDGAARRIARDVAWVASTARVESRAYAMAFDAATSSYSVAGLPDIDHPTTDYAVDLRDDHDGVTMASANFGGVETLTFDGFGRPAVGGTIVIQSGNHQRSIVVDSSGKASVQ